MYQVHLLYFYTQLKYENIAFFNFWSNFEFHSIWWIHVDWNSLGDMNFGVLKRIVNTIQ